jgi:hypothetical protein
MWTWAYSGVDHQPAVANGAARRGDYRIRWIVNFWVSRSTSWVRM